MKRLLKKAIRKYLTLLSNYIYSFVIFERFLLKRKIVGNKEASNKVCVFSHFDKDGIVEEYVKYYIEDLCAAGFSIVFVTTSPFIRDVDLEFLRNKCYTIIIKRNIGRDIGAYYTGLKILEFDKIDSLLLANDSVYGPFYSLADQLSNGSSYDLYGITDSYDIRYHLQSYFLLFNKRAIDAGLIKKFLSSYRNFFTKRLIIEKFEIGFTLNAQKLGLNPGSLCNYRDIRKEILGNKKKTSVFQSVSQIDYGFYNANPTYKINDKKSDYLVLLKNSTLNPTHFLWLELIENYDCPFLKIELLRDNPADVNNIDAWEDLIATKFPHYNVSMVISHLKRFLKNRLA